MEQAIKKWANKTKDQAQKELDNIQDPIDNPDLFKNPIIREMAKVLILKYGAEYLSMIFSEAIQYEIFMDGDLSAGSALQHWKYLQEAKSTLAIFRKNFE